MQESTAEQGTDTQINTQPEKGCSIYLSVCIADGQSALLIPGEGKCKEEAGREGGRQWVTIPTVNG